MANLRDARAECERRYIRRACEANDGKIQETAEQLGVNRSHLWKKMKGLALMR